MCPVPPNDLRELFIRVPRSIRAVTGTAGNGIPDGRSIAFSLALYTSVAVGIRVARGILKFHVRERHGRAGIISCRSQARTSDV